jgi:hypothetical protein
MKNSPMATSQRKEVGWSGFCGGSKDVGNNNQKNGCEKQVFETELFAQRARLRIGVGASVDNCGAGCGSQVAGPWSSPPKLKLRYCAAGAAEKQHVFTCALVRGESVVG